MKIKWDVTFSNYTHEIIYEGNTFLGKAKIQVDGTYLERSPVLVKGVGLFYPMLIDGSEIILRLDLGYRVQGLSRNGIDVSTGQPLGDSILSAYRAALQSGETQQLFSAKDAVITGSFGIFSVLTILNLFLFLSESGRHFPFSAFIPQVLLSLGLNSPNSIPFAISAAFIILAFALAAGCLLLVALSLKKTWPVLVGLIFVVIDSIVLLYFAIGGFGANIIDIAFHIWVLCSMISLYVKRLQIEKEIRTPDMEVRQ
jgi:hypothetical protein